MSRITLFLSLALLAVVALADDLKIASFNVQVFGARKMAKPHVVENLVKIMRNYDLVFFQEIRDSANKSIYELHDLLNERLRNRYKLFVSDRLGRSHSKEQYGFFYREDDLELMGTYQYPSQKEFERPPIVAEFKPLKADSDKFMVIGCHIKPGDAEGEMARLLKVYNVAKEKFGNENAILMGDFNAGCSYVRKTKWMNHALRSNKDLTWLIPDDAKTTTKGSGCPYDRFVIAGKKLQDSVVRNSAKTFFFDGKLHLDAKTTQEISDHYPIEMKLT